LIAACGSPDTSGGDGTEPTPGATSTPTATPEPVELLGTRWLLASLDGAAIDPEIAITLSFTAAQAGGEVGCIAYGAAYIRDGDALALPEVLATPEGCGQAVKLADLADAYYAALESVASYDAGTDRLELTRTDGTSALVYTSDRRPRLDGTFWYVIEFEGDELVQYTFLRTSFDGDRLTAWSLCHVYSGNYRADHDGAFSATALVETEIAEPQVPCDEATGIPAQDRAYAAALAEVTSYRIDIHRDRLELCDAGGAVRAVLGNEAQPPLDLLAWSGWVLEEMNGRALTGAPSIVLRFSNWLYADADCLSFSANATTAPDGEISHLPLDWYDGGCNGAAPGTDAQEYRATLETVTQYSLTSERLEFLNAEGVVVLSYRPGLLEGNGLERTRWVLLELGGAPAVPGAGVTLAFEDNGLPGSAGCNEYGGQYVVAVPGEIALYEVAINNMD